MQKSNCLLKTWLTKMPVFGNSGEVILILVYISKRKDLPSVLNILWVFHSNFSRVIKYCTIISNVQWLSSLTITIRIFYKFVLYIKPRYICCHLQKKINKKLHQNFTCLKPAKKYVIWLINSMKVLDIHHSIFLRQSRSGKCHFVYGGIWSNLTFSSTHQGLFLLISSEICWDTELIFNLCYHIVVLKKKKLVKLLKIALLGPYLGKNWASMGHALNETQFFENNKRSS